jgi:hypothetical protein
VNVTEDDKRAFLGTLLKAKAFQEAYKIWSRGRPASGGFESVVNGDFEEPIMFDDLGFGWQLATKSEAVGVYSDTQNPRTGSHSLRLDFNGNVDPLFRAVSQLVLVKPNTRYELKVSIRAADFSTLGLPRMMVLDANDGRTPLSQPLIVKPGTYPWADYTVQFTTPGITRAVIISLQRQGCTGDPCGVYGNLWLDSVSLRRL